MAQLRPFRYVSAIDHFVGIADMIEGLIGFDISGERNGEYMGFPGR